MGGLYALLWVLGWWVLVSLWDELRARRERRP